MLVVFFLYKVMTDVLRLYTRIEDVSDEAFTKFREITL